MFTRFGLRFVLIMSLFWTGCAEPEPTVTPTCEVCEAGSQKCLGEYAATCDDDGGGWTAISCLATQTCEASSGECKTSLCPERGYRGCSGPETVETCVAGALEKTACGVGEMCEAGRCVAATQEATYCGYKALITVADGGVTSVACGAGQVCFEEGEDGPACGLPVCVPGERICRDRDGDGINEISQVCNQDGTGADGSLEEDCGAMLGTCIAGFCSCAEPVTDSEQDVEVPGEPEAEDVIVGDISIGFADTFVEADVPELQAPNQAEAWVGGSKIKFTSYAKVNYQENVKRLVIAFANGQKKVEIGIAEATETWSGTVTEQTPGAFIGFNDGSGVTGEFKWGAGASPNGTVYEGGTMSVTIDENGGPGGRVVGTFQADLGLAPGEDGAPIGMSDGSFDIHFTETDGAE